MIMMLLLLKTLIMRWLAGACHMSQITCHMSPLRRVVAALLAAATRRVLLRLHAAHASWTAAGNAALVHPLLRRECGDCQCVHLCNQHVSQKVIAAGDGGVLLRCP